MPSAVKDNAEICRVGMRFAVSGMEAIMEGYEAGSLPDEICDKWTLSSEGSRVLSHILSWGPT